MDNNLGLNPNLLALIPQTPIYKLGEEQKRRIKICLLARLVCFSTHFAPSIYEDNSWTYNELSNCFYILYQGLTNEKYIPPSEKFSAEETLRILWGIKQGYIFQVFLHRPWSPNYHLYTGAQLEDFFVSLKNLVEGLTRAEQFELQNEAFRFYYGINKGNPATFRKLQQPESTSFLSKKTGTGQDGGPKS